MPIPTKVTFKRVKRLSLRITPTGELHISAPIGLPKSEVKRFLIANEQWIQENYAKVTKRIEARDAFYAQLSCQTKEQQKEIAEQMKAKTLPMVHKYEKQMGVSCNRITFKNVTSKWGACNYQTKHIIFSVYLLLLPDWCIEHVVVHELAHLLVPNHSAAFHKVMDTYFPRWKEARAETRRISRMEEEDSM